jgi:hypothetical protein
VEVLYFVSVKGFVTGGRHIEKLALVLPFLHLFVAAVVLVEAVGNSFAFPLGACLVLEAGQVDGDLVMLQLFCSLLHGGFVLGLALVVGLGGQDFWALLPRATRLLAFVGTHLRGLPLLGARFEEGIIV